MSAGVARAYGTHEVATHGERLIVVGHWSGLSQRVIPLMSNAGLTLEFFDTMNPDDAAELYADHEASRRTRLYENFQRLQAGAVRK